MEAYAWDNRVKFIVRYMYDTDNNGYLDANDFDTLSLKYALYEGKGKYCADAHAKNKKIMLELWNDIAAVADFNKDGQVTVDEFKAGVKTGTLGKKFEEFPKSLQHAITGKFQQTDLNGDGRVSLEEFRLECVSRSAFSTVKEIDECYNKLLDEADKGAGGLSLGRYQELYAQFLGNPEADVAGSYLFGPLIVLE